MNLKISSFLKALISMKWIDDLGTTPVSLDVPAWWTTAKKSHLYADAFAPFSGKTILVSALTFGSPTKKLVNEFNNIEAYIRATKVPTNPFLNQVDVEKVAQGKEVFNFHCAGCHGKYENGALQEGFHAKTIDIYSVKTDSSPLYEGVTREFRRRISNSWVGDYYERPIRITPVGYQAPPLLGLWASAPYFHNGSVPTVYHVLFPEERPALWKSKKVQLNLNTLGLDFETVEEIPLVLTDKERRHYYDTSQYSLSNEGHDYPEKLTRDERMLVLEYLKTL